MSGPTFQSPGIARYRDAVPTPDRIRNEAKIYIAKRTRAPAVSTVNHNIKSTESNFHTLSRHLQRLNVTLHILQNVNAPLDARRSHRLQSQLEQAQENDENDTKVTME